MKVETFVCKRYEGTCSLKKKQAKIFEGKIIRIEKCVNRSDDDPLMSFKLSTPFYASHIYLPKDYSQYPILYNDIVSKKSENIEYTLSAEVEQKYANSEFYQRKTNEKQIIEIRNIKLKDLFSIKIVSTYADVIIKKHFNYPYSKTGHLFFASNL
jgi:hypothetical protein